MPAGKLNLYIEQGSDFSRILTFKSDGIPVDLTGSTFSGSIRKTISDASKILDFTCELLNQVVNTGQVKISLTNSQTSQIPLKAQRTAKRVTESFAYDIEITWSDGRIERALEGVVEVSPEVTR